MVKESACNERELGTIPGQEDPLEKGMATHSSILAWRIPWTEEPGGLQSIGLERVRHDWVANKNKINLQLFRTTASQSWMGLTGSDYF